MIELLVTKRMQAEEQAWWSSQGISLRSIPLLQTQILALYSFADCQESIFIFTSKKAIHSLHQQLTSAQWQSISNRNIACVAPVSNAYLETLGLKADITANSGKELAEEIKARFSPQVVRYFCSLAPSPYLADTLQEAGFNVRRSRLYKTILSPQDIDWQLARGIIFYSPSAVKSFFQANEWPADKLAFAIGPVTARALYDHNIPCAGYPEAAQKEALLATLSPHLQLQNS
ncbi:MAG: uroporphyrinogen-III synthase [Bacteroidota bacterium]